MRRPLRSKIVLTLAASLALPAVPCLQAAPPVTPSAPAAAQPTARSAPAAPAIVDVALADGGRLAGQVLDSGSIAQPGRPIAVFQHGQLVAAGGSDAAGNFAIEHLAGGIYELQCDGRACVARLWAPGTAPPAARTSLILTTGGEVVRGQTTFGPFTGDWLKGRGPWLIAAAAIVAVPTALALNLKPKSPAS